VTARKNQINVDQLVVSGLVIGYLYLIVLSASAIAVCETKRPGQCSEAWNRGYATATGLVTTFLAYLVPPAGRTPTRTPKREETNAGSEGA
jgi:hypothetical protein